MAEQSLVFGPYRLDPTGVVSRDGQPLPIGRRGVRLLEMLLSRRGQVVSKADLIDAAWPDETVEENNLSVQIAQLRKRLGGTWIRTVERVGYQLLNEPPPEQERPTPSLCIRPFRAFGDGAAFAEGLTDELTTALARFGSLRVVASRVGFIAADYVLEGSVRIDEGTLQVAVRLAEQRSGHYVWAQTVAVPGARRTPVDLVTSMVEAQVELAEIAAARRERPEGASAPDLFRRAQWHMQSSLPDSYAAATALLEQALSQDPDNTQYLGAMCEAIGHRISMGWPDLPGAGPDRLFACASHGLRQPAADPDAIALFGFGLFRAGDRDGGYDLMRHAADLNPNSGHALKLAGQAAMNSGNLAEAVSYFRKVLALDPHHSSRGPAMGGMARIEMAAGHFEDALLWANRAHLAHRTFGGAHWTLIAASALLGRAAESARYLDRFRADCRGVTIARIKAAQPSRAPMSATLEGLDRAGMARG